MVVDELPVPALAGKIGGARPVRVQGGGPEVHRVPGDEPVPGDIGVVGEEGAAQLGGAGQQLVGKVDAAAGGRDVLHLKGVVERVRHGLGGEVQGAVTRPRQGALLQKGVVPGAVQGLPQVVLIDGGAVAPEVELAHIVGGDAQYGVPVVRLSACGCHVNGGSGACGGEAQGTQGAGQTAGQVEFHGKAGEAVHQLLPGGEGPAGLAVLLPGEQHREQAQQHCRGGQGGGGEHGGPVRVPLPDQGGEEQDAPAAQQHHQGQAAGRQGNTQSGEQGQSGEDEDGPDRPQADQQQAQHRRQQGGGKEHGEGNGPGPFLLG